MYRKSNILNSHENLSSMVTSIRIYTSWQQIQYSTSSGILHAGIALVSYKSVCRRNFITIIIAAVVCFTLSPFCRSVPITLAGIEIYQQTN